MKYAGESYSDLGKKIKAIRLDAGMTQAELAKDIVTRNMLSRIENGEALPSVQTLCRLAEKLGVQPGYLLDDRDDGTKRKNERLLSMIKKEFASGNYDICLQYCRSLEHFGEEKSKIHARSLYLLGIQKMLGNYPVKEAQWLISEALKSEDFLDKSMKVEGKVYRALLDGFAFAYESGREESFIVRLKSFASAPCDIAIFSSAIAYSLKKTDNNLDNLLPLLLFENQAYTAILSGLTELKAGRYTTAYSKFVEALSGKLPSPIRCFVLTLLENTSVSLNEFDKAYSYMTMRKELVSKLLKKVEISEKYY